MTDDAAAITVSDLALPLEAADIMRIIPHRYPFLLIDRVVELVPGKSVVAMKSVTANEPQFTGHFPDRPIMPGVLMVEALAQAGAVVTLEKLRGVFGRGRGVASVDGEIAVEATISFVIPRDQSIAGGRVGN